MEPIKKHLYFIVARYFRFWARIRLERWMPRVIVVTGSSGKTTLLHLLEAQLGKAAKVSHHANSTYGVPFDILGLAGTKGSLFKWLSNALIAPIRSLTYPSSGEFYLVEVDAERPGEAPFLIDLLRPEISLWVTSGKTHTMFYDQAVAKGKYKDVEEGVAKEFAAVGRHTHSLVVANGDNKHIVENLKDLRANLEFVRREDLVKYNLKGATTEYELSNGVVYSIPGIHPIDIFYQVGMVDHTMTYLKKTPDYEFLTFDAPPGRSSVFKGVKDTHIIDSTYNANFMSLKAVLELYELYPSNHKWIVIGDMLELGESSKAEHEKLGKLISKMKIDRCIFVGKHVSEDTFPIVKEAGKFEVEKFDSWGQSLDYIHDNLKKGQTLLFKGSQSNYLEAIVELLLKHKSDKAKLPRRGDFWDQKRHAAK